MRERPVWPTVLALLAPCAAAVIAMHPVLGLGFLSDDFWWTCLLDKSVAHADVDWGELARDFTGPWLGNEVGAFYRPLVTVGFGINYELGGGSALPFHLWNLLQHALSSSLCGAVCALCCPSRPRLAGFAGGMLFALHPSAVEPVAWASAATSTQEVFFRLASLASYAWFLSSHRRRWLVISVAFAAATLWTKESGLMLPLSILVVDVLHPHRSSATAKALRLVPFVAVAGLYAFVRLSLPGLTLGEEGADNPFVESLLQTLPSKLEALAIPFGIAGPIFEQHGTWFVIGLVVVAAAALRTRPALLALGVAWILIQFVPSAPFPVLPTYFGSRMVYGVVSSLALVCCVAIFASSTGVRLRLAGCLLLGAATAAFAILGQRRIDAYERADADMTRFRAELEAAGESATPERPLAILTVPPDADGIMRMAPPCVFVAAERPHASRNIPLLNLAFFLAETHESKSLHKDPGPVRAMWQVGARLLLWDPEAGTWRPQQRDASASLPALDRQGDTLEWRFRTPADPYEIAGLTLAAPATVTGARVRWNAAVPGAPLPMTRTDGGWLLDLSHDLTFFSLKMITGSVSGFTVEVDGPGDAGALELRALAALPGVELQRTLSGETVAFEDLTAVLVPPGGAERLVLLTPSAGHAIALEGGKLELGRDVQLQLLWMLARARQGICYYYFEGPGRRSAVDWFRMTRREPRRRWPQR